ncbi:MAG: hypothetical protein ACRDWY_18815 [Actinomycetes bacterium]
MSAGPGTLRRSLLAGWLVALVMIAAACSDEEKPGTLPKSTTPAPSSASPSPSATTPEQQVEAAVRTYYAELTRAAQTNDTSQLKTLVHRGCPCYRAVTVIDKNRAEGELTRDIDIELTMVKVHDVIDRTAAAEIKTRDSAYDVVDQSGKVVDHIRAAKTHLDLSLVKSSEGRWIVTNLFNLEGD